MVIVNERENTQEMAIVSSRTDDGLKDIDIAVYSNEYPPKHATILKRGNHKTSFGRFLITPNAPKSHTDIKEVKEEIDAGYKRQIFEWSKKKSFFIKERTNWEFLNVMWNVLNPVN
jgi:hypothetical protein